MDAELRSLFGRLRRLLGADWRRPATTPAQPADDAPTAPRGEPIAGPDTAPAVSDAPASVAPADETDASALHDAAIAVSDASGREMESELDGEPTTGLVEARQQRYAERLLGDERVRASLTDDEFQPLQDWALRALDRVAADTAVLPEPAAEERLETAFQAIRDVLIAGDLAIGGRFDRTADQFAAALRSIEAPLTTLVSDGAGPDNAAPAIEALVERLAAGKDEMGGPELAAELAATLADLTATSDRSDA